MTFFGTQPTFTHVPPRRAGSKKTTLAPRPAARCAVASPPLPPPSTIKSNDFTVEPLSDGDAAGAKPPKPASLTEPPPRAGAARDAPALERRARALRGTPLHNGLPRPEGPSPRQGRDDVAARPLTASADPSSDNPLLADTGLPRFDRIRPEHVEPAVRRTLEAQRAAIAEAERVERPGIDWLARLERIHDEVRRVWGPVSHLNSVASTPPLRDAYN